MRCSRTFSGAETERSAGTLPLPSRRLAIGSNRWLSICFSLVLLAGCASPPVEQTDLRVDLTQVFQVAHALLEPDDIQIGSPEADRYLGDDWSDAEVWSDGRAVRAIAGPRARLRILFDEPADRPLSIRCASRSATRRHVLVRVDLNRRRVGTFTISDRLADHALVLPARMQKPGENEITLSSGSLRPRARSDGKIGDVVVERVRFVDARPVGRRPRADGDTLAFPVPSTFGFFARVPTAATLGFDLGGRPGAAMTVEVTAESASDVFTRHVATPGPATVDLGAFAGRTMHMMLRTARERVGEETVTLAHPGLSGLVPSSSRLPVERMQRKPNVLVYLIDTLRADHLGAYGYRRATSPRIDAFAREAITFTNAVAQSSWTRPAVATLLTGLNPPLHGAVSIRDALRLDVPTMAELLRNAGYDTAGFVTNYNVAPRWGLNRGFQDYKYLPEDEHSPTVHVRADALNREVFAWLEQRASSGDRPFFLYVHATDPHAPYTPPSEFAERLGASANAAGLLARLRKSPGAATAAEVRQLVAAYDAEIAFVDHHFGELIAKLRAMKLWDSTLVVVTADHGEEFLDHGDFEHGRTLYQEQIHVPLVMRFPGDAGAGTRFASTARQADVLPTVLDYAGVEGPAVASGRSLLASGSGAWPDEAFSQASLGRNALTAYLFDGWKIVVGNDSRSQRVQAYDLADDPGERSNRASEQPERVGYAKQAIAASSRASGLRAAPSLRRGARVDPGTEERLRALGYTD